MASNRDVFQRVLDRLLPSVTIHDIHPLVPFIMLDAPFASRDRLQSLASLGALVNSTLADTLGRILQRSDTLRVLKDDVRLWKPLPDTVSNIAI